MQKKTRAKRQRKKLKRAEKISLRQKINPYLSLKHPITRFCLLFLALLLIFSFLLYIKFIEQYLSNPITPFIASQTAWILRTLGMKVYASGIIMSGESFSVQISENCSPILVTLIFLSAVIAFPASLKEKMFGSVLGIIFIYLLNLFRIISIFLVGVYAPQYFKEAHIYVSQTICIVVVAIFWLLWAGKWVKSIPAQ